MPAAAASRRVRLRGDRACLTAAPARRHEASSEPCAMTTSSRNVVSTTSTPATRAPARRARPDPRASRTRRRTPPPRGTRGGRRGSARPDEGGAGGRALLRIAASRPPAGDVERRPSACASHANSQDDAAAARIARTSGAGESTALANEPGPAGERPQDERQEADRQRRAVRTQEVADGHPGSVARAAFGTAGEGRTGLSLV